MRSLPTHLVLVLTCALLFLATACGTARRGIPLVGPREITDPQLLLGQRAFDANCHQCHPGGEAGLGFALNDKPLPGWLVKFQVRNGLGAMPAFSREQISDEELDALVKYLKWLRRLEPVAGDFNVIASIEPQR